MTPYKRLTRTFDRIHHLDHVLAMLQWDEAVVMPVGGADSRAAAMAEIQVMRIEILKDAKILDWLVDAEAVAGSLSDWERANLSEIRRIVNDANAVDTDLVEALTKQRVICERNWREQRARNDWEGFAPAMGRMVDLVREEGQQRAQGSSWTPYEALMRLYEPDLTASLVNSWFSKLREVLPGLINQAIELQSSRRVLEFGREFSIAQQKTVMHEFMRWLGFNFSHGRLDESHHPFCGGVSQDVRLTTRYNVHGFLQGLMGVLHETGHAMYEQNRPRQWLHQPVGQARGMVVHESQSLFVEMQVGRSLAFYKYAAVKLRDAIGEIADLDLAWAPENLFELGRKVERDYIRVDANELTYPMHVLLRFEIEQALISGDLLVRDLPDAWDQGMKKYLGLETKGRDDIGCMQDVHWPAGLFGYFPCYTLGAMMAAQLFSAMEKQIPSVQKEIEMGNFGLVHDWLKANVWERGSLLSRGDLIREATGEELNPSYFLRHLENRYLKS